MNLKIKIRMALWFSLLVPAHVNVDGLENDCPRQFEYLLTR